MKNSNIIVHKKRKTPFTIVPNELWDDDRLSWKAKAILGYLIGKPEGWKVRTGDLCKKSTDRLCSVRSGLKELRRAGYAKLERVKGTDGRVAEWLLKIADTPVFALNLPESDFPHLDDPRVESPRVENRHHSNKDGVARVDSYQEADASASRGEASSRPLLPRGRKNGSSGCQPTSSALAPAPAGGDDEENFELDDRGKALQKLWDEYFFVAFRRKPKHTEDDRIALQQLSQEAPVREIMGFILSAWSFKRKESGFDPYFYCTRYSSRPRDICMIVCKDGINNLEKMRAEMSWRGTKSQIEFGYQWFEKLKANRAAPVVKT